MSSAIAVPELVGVPATHRGLSQGFTVVSGHAAPGDPRSQLDWAALARTGTTLVLLMAVDTLPAIADALLAGGLEPATPVCCSPGRRPARPAGADRDPGRRGPGRGRAGAAAPGVIVIGPVAALAGSGAGRRRPGGRASRYRDPMTTGSLDLALRGLRRQDRHQACAAAVPVAVRRRVVAGRGVARAVRRRRRRGLPARGRPGDLRPDEPAAGGVSPAGVERAVSGSAG